MSPRNFDKNKDVIKELEKTISPILVVNNSALKPYVELFEYAPENIYQQPLGCLVGFFEIKEFSEESAYIVNFLTSVLKKEYYINPKRPVTESLDSALHKVNMALSELAKQGNVEWLGKLNAAICVLEKNNAHFSVSGNAKIFLYRNQALSEISEDLASDSLDPHPLKTFVNVSSGRLEKDDRLLITSADIFHILTAAEIKKNLQRFEGDKFVQFLKTALSNQLEMIVSIIIEMTEAVPVPTAKTTPRKKSPRAVNAFSEQTFANTPSSNTLAQEQELDTTIEPQAEPEYTDKKTGHIYVQGEAMENSEVTHAQMNLYWDMVKEKIAQGSYLTKNEIRKRFSLYKKQLAKKKELRRIEKERQQQIQAEENKRLEEERAIWEIEHQKQLAQEAELERIRLEQETELEQIRLAQEKIEQEELQRIQLKEENEREQIRLAQEKIEQEELATKAATTKKKPETKILVKNEDEEIQAPTPQLSFKEKLRLARLEQQGNAVIDLSLKNKAPEPEKEIELLPEDEQLAEPEPEIKFEIIKENSKAEKLKTFAQQSAEQVLPLSKRAIAFTKAKLARPAAKTKASDIAKPNHLNITPHFSKIGKLFSRFSAKQKLFTLFALVLIFIVPLFIVHFLNKPKEPTITDLQATPPSQAELLANEKNIRLGAQVQTVFSNKDIITTLIANGNPTAITKTGITVLQNNQPKEFPLPANSGTPIRAAYMNDLSLVFVLTDSNKVLSFSPVSEKFTDNKINLANISSTSFIGTYLTYLYVLDQKTNQIYRFPRAEGGFGEKTNWLKDSVSLAQVSDMTIDDNIYAVANNQILKFFKGQQQTFALEASATPVHFDKIYTTPDLQAFYVLDTQNSRVIAYNKDGSILAQFHNEAIKDGTFLTVDEKNKLAYITTTSGLISLSIQ